MIVTATEFRLNLGFYLDLVEEEDIVVTRAGRPAALLTRAAKGTNGLLDMITGIVPADISLAQGGRERRREDESGD